jgi:hypothetical protein
LENQGEVAGGNEKACNRVSPEEATVRIQAIVFTLVAAQAVMAQAGEGFGFRVQVVNSITGAPIPSANVVVQNEQGPATFGKSDSGGQFTGHLPSTGRYLLTVRRNGFRIVGTVPMGVMLNIEASGENSASVKMLPLGMIIGRVLDQYGDPLRHALVHGLQKGGAASQIEYYQGFSSGTSDDHGEYRIANVEPGSYYVAAEYSSSEGTGSGSPEIGGVVLFPDVTDLAGAQQVEVSAGATTRVNDLHLKLQRSVSISGRVKPSAPADSMLRRAGPVLGLNVFAGQGGQTDSHGSFTFRVLPGRYVLSASDRQGKTSKEVTVEALDKDVSGIELTLDTSYEINGHIIVDGTAFLDYSKIMLHFMGAPVKFASDGSFHANAGGAKAMYMLRELPPDWYLKDVTVGGKILTGRHFELEPGTTDVAFHLKSDGGSVEFTSPSGGHEFLVMVLPENGPVLDVESMLHAEPGSSGKLVVHGVRPGSYRVFALDATNFIFLYQPQLLLDKYKSAGTLITVAPGEHKSIVVPIAKIPPE